MAIGVAFAYAGFVKLATPLQFADSIASFQLLPDALVNIAAIGLPPIEILAGAIMIVGRHYRSANLTAIALAGIFAFALLQALARGLQVDCGCFGSDQPSLSKTWIALMRDLLIFLASLWLYRSSMSQMRQMNLLKGLPQD
jgi:putative oxidoreductase